MFLYQVLDEVGTVAWQHVDDRNLDHGVATWLQAHRGTSYVDQHLTSQCRVVNLHVELHALVLGLTADTLADKVYAMSHIANVINAFYLEDVCLVVGKVRVGLDVLSNLLQCEAILQLNVYHTTVDAFAQGDCHRQGILHARLRTDAD